MKAFNVFYLIYKIIMTILFVGLVTFMVLTNVLHYLNLTLDPDTFTFVYCLLLCSHLAVAMSAHQIGKKSESSKNE